MTVEELDGGVCITIEEVVVAFRMVGTEVVVAPVVVGTSTCPSLLWLTGTEVLLCLVVMETDDGGWITSLEMPNWVEYWYCPVPPTMIWIP